MSFNTSNDQNRPPDTEEYYEAVACQEEIYLEETEEEIRAILIFDDPPAVNSDGTWSANRAEPEPDGEVSRSMSDTNNEPCTAESLDEKLTHAAEELITGDSDDPPLSEKAVTEMLNDAPTQRLGSGRWQWMG